MNTPPPARDPAIYEDAFEEKRYHDDDDASVAESTEENEGISRPVVRRPPLKKPTYRPTRRYYEE